MTPSASYRGAGVDIEAGDRAVELMRSHVASTQRSEVIGGLGGFAGAFSAAFKGVEEPVLLSAADGVGTKLLIAQTLGRHDTVGIDLVAMVVDDLVCHAAEPLFLLDYIACGKLVPETIERIVAGIAKGCRQAGCALLGGETAEHPGVMEPDAYDLAAFAVGVAGRKQLWGPERVQEGDAVIGIASSGLNSNGFSLVRRLILEHDLKLDEPVPTLGGATLGDALLVPTAIYAPAMLALEREHGIGVRAAAHITGGGIEGNLVRVLPEGLEAVLDPTAWPVPAIFSFLAETGHIAEEEMRKAFNLGLGMTMVIAEGDVDRAVTALGARGLAAFLVGSIHRGDRGVAREERST